MQLCENGSSHILQTAESSETRTIVQLPPHPKAYGQMQQPCLTTQSQQLLDLHFGKPKCCHMQKDFLFKL